MSSPSKALDHYQLMSPSPEIPWSVDVISAIPSELVEGPLQRYVVGQCRFRWHCLGTADAKGKCTFHVWYSSPTDSLRDQKFKQQVLHLDHPKISLVQQEGSAEAVEPLLALEVSPLQQDVVYIYAVHPTEGVVVLWKISRDDFGPRLANKAAPQHCSVAHVPLEETTSDGTQERLHSLTISCLQARQQVVVLGTSTGTVYWVVRTKSPTALHLQRATPERTGLLTRILGTTGYHAASSLIAALAIKPRQFFSICEKGSIVQWKVKGTDSSHKSLFEATERMELLETLKQTSLLPVKSLRVLRASTTSVAPSDGSDTAATLHLLVLTVHEKDEISNDESRLHWICVSASVDGTLTVKKTAWLNRFVAPECVIVVGLVVTDNGMGYAAFQQEAHLPAIVIALDWNGVIQELDLPVQNAPSLLIGTLGKDVVTHGCTVLATSGVGLRVRKDMEDHATSPQRRGRGNLANIHTLTTHLRSVFWESYEHPDRSARLPPSITTANPADLEDAIHAVAIQLQEKGNVSSTHNPLEWHGALINLLQLTGLYRQLSAVGKWKLLAIGQEVSVFLSLGNVSKETEWEEDQQARLPSSNLAVWLSRVQDSVLTDGGGEDRLAIFVRWLRLALDTAMTYRAECADVRYDVQPNKPPSVQTPAHVPMWTSQTALEDCVERQLVHWQSNPSMAYGSDVEMVVELGLQCFADSYTSCPCDETKQRFATLTKYAIAFLRKIKSIDEDRLAFELSSAHSHYAGLCQISLDHEKRKDREEFSLFPLFDKLSSGSDVESNMPFALFVLKWHADRELFGHVLDYGKRCPEVLNTLLACEKSLAPFRWIQAILQNDYDDATVSLMENVEGDTSLSDAKFALSVAAIANRVFEEESPAGAEVAAKRRKMIETKRELVIAQESLFGKTKESEFEFDSSSLYDSEELLEVALGKIDEADERDEKIEICFIGLAIATTCGFPRRAAVKVWRSALETDSDAWQTWLHKETDLTDSKLRDAVLETTVFGGLLYRCEQEDSWENVTYGPEVEGEVFEKLSGDYELELAGLRRLLRNVVQQEWENSSEHSEL